MLLRQNVDALQIKQNIEVNLKRLARQYQYSVLHYDEASLLDLSHVLRVWLDMQENVEAYLVEQSIPYRFKKYTLGPSLLKRCHGSKCVIAYFVDGVTTYTDGSTFSVSTSLSTGPHSMSVSWRPLGGRGLIARHLVVIAEARVNYDFHSDTAFLVQETTFRDWLKAESVRVWFANPAGKSHEKIISREMLIKRVANALGGSHPAGVFDVPNKYDEAVAFLLKFRVGEIPLPYYVLLKTAHDILDCFGALPTMSLKQTSQSSDNYSLPVC